MGTYIGDVYVPNIGKISEPESGSIEIIKGLNIRRPLTVWHPSDLMSLDMEGILYTTGGKDAEDYAEDLRALLRDPSYNFFDFAERKGFLALSAVPKLDRSAEKALVIPYSLDVMFHPNSHFVRKYKTNPSVYNNDFSFTFGSDGCDNYIALPIGSSYSGGDGSTITTTSKDGTITLVKANTSQEIEFDNDDEADTGECKVFDTVTTGNSDEDTWIQVFNADHVFKGDLVAENGIVRVKIANNDTRKYFTVYYYVDSSWTQVGNLIHIRDNGSSSGANIYDKAVKSINPDSVTVEIISDVDTFNTYIDIIRGHNFLKFYTSGASGDSMSVCSTWGTGATKRFAYLHKSSPILRDGMFDNDIVDVQNTDDDNFGLSFDETESYFSGGVSLVGNSSSRIIRITNDNNDYYGLYLYSKDDNPFFIFRVDIAPSNFYKEAESMDTDGSPAYYTGTDASPKTGNTGISMDTQNQRCKFYYTGGTDIEKGTYRFFVRAKDSNQVSDDLKLNVDNNTDSVTVASNTHTMTSSFDYYYLDFTLDDDDMSGDNIGCYITKNTADANTIDVDYAMIIPITRDNGDGAKDIARRCMVNQNLKRQLVLR